MTDKSILFQAATSHTALEPREL